MRPVRALINPDALRHNFARVRSFASLASIMAVIKANGYGHGLVWTAKTLHDAGAFLSNRTARKISRYRNISRYRSK